MTVTTMIMNLMLMMNYLSLYKLKSFSLGILILMLAFLMSIFMSLNCISWFALMFFMVYMGGLLVLLFYLSSLNFNPVMKYYSSFPKVNLLMLVILSSLSYMIVYSCSNFAKFLKSNMKKYSLNLFKVEEMEIMASIGVMLLMVLWVMNKITFQSARGPLRPFSE